MIDLYTWPTPNGHKVHILLEETGLEYTVIPISILTGDQFEPEFLKISPNNRMPAMVDQDGPSAKPYAIFESGAMLLYLAEKTGQFMPKEMAKRYTVVQWLMFQMGGIGPMLGQAHHFRLYAPEKIDYACNQYSNEASRLYHVVDKCLAKVVYLASDYSIADMATYPWLRYRENQGQKLEDYTHIKRWYDLISEQPAFQRGLAVLQEERRTPQQMDQKAKDLLFGAGQFEKR